MSSNTLQQRAKALDDNMNGIFEPPRTLSLLGESVGRVSSSSNAGPARYFEAGQSKAIEQLVKLKAELRDAGTESFWEWLLEGTSEICGAQCAFVAKNMAADDIDTDMGSLPLNGCGAPPLGVGYYYNDGHGTKAMHKDYKNLASDIPSAFMKYDKVSLVAEKLGSSFGGHTNTLPFPMEAYLSVPVPLNRESNACFALMWTTEGLKACNVSWAYLEMILHSLEDLIQHRLVEEDNNRRWALEQKRDDDNRKAPHEFYRTVPYGSPSFKPYARSLSHELRTPMQGVVGMTDVMYTTVQETIETTTDANMLKIFRRLKEDIEAVQDSARRAVEAADNIVHSWDLNMQVPDSPYTSGKDEDLESPTNGAFDRRPSIVIGGNNTSVHRPKRTFEQAQPVSFQLRSPKRRPLSPLSTDVKSVVEQSDKIVHASPHSDVHKDVVNAVDTHATANLRRTPLSAIVHPPMVLHDTKVRELLRRVVHESLNTGSRPASVDATPTTHGERIDVRVKSPSGQYLTKVVDWSVEPSVPELLYVDEKDLVKLVSCVLLNALKFTESGTIVLTTRYTVEHQVLIRISDTGIGIPESFFPHMFDAFAREDISTTRATEGLGLGLMVAKGLSRKLGGDLVCVRSSTTGPDRGSEFEIRLPMSPGYIISRPGSPHTCPSTAFNEDHQQPPGSDTATSTSDNSMIARGSAATTPPNMSPDKITDALSPDQVEASMFPRCGIFEGTPARTEDISGRQLARKYPLTFMVAEDNQINRSVLVRFLSQLGYRDVYEAYDGRGAVRIMSEILSGNSPGGMEDYTSPIRHGSDASMHSPPLLSDMEIGSQESTKKTPTKPKAVDVILMDLWMPDMDGYEATEKIFELIKEHNDRLKSHPDFAVYVQPAPTVLAVSADATDEALVRAEKVGMEGYMSKPYKRTDLERLIVEFCEKRQRRN